MFTQTEFVAAHTSRSLSFAALGFMDLITKWATVEGTNGFFPEYKLAQIEGALDLAMELVNNDEWAVVSDEGVIYGYRAKSLYEKNNTVAEDDEVIITVDAQVDVDSDISDIAQEIIDEVSLEIEEEELEERLGGSMEADEDRVAEESHTGVSTASEKMAALSGGDRFRSSSKAAAVAPETAAGFEDEELEEGFQTFADAYPLAVDVKNDRIYYNFCDAAERINSIRDIVDLARGLSVENAPARVSQWLKNISAI